MACTTAHSMGGRVSDRQSPSEDTVTERATQQDGTYPRPQLVREQWTDLTGTWQFRHDNSDTGRAQQWHLGTEAFERAITVPYPPESTRSGVANPGPHPRSEERRVGKERRSQAHERRSRAE